MNVVIDPLLCSACGLCADMCPDVFEMGVDAAEVIVDTVPLDLMDPVTDAEEECPTGAISSS